MHMADVLSKDTHTHTAFKAVHAFPRSPPLELQERTAHVDISSVDPYMQGNVQFCSSSRHGQE